ncbi:MAG: hypothetical protein HQL52_07880 [Magnetococcales bacterium]|nr:hypothetical protein [Magnetococcales bacterium]
MAARCGLCRGSVDDQTAICRRCGADLGLVWQAKSTANALVTSAIGTLAQGDLDKARHLTSQAALYHNDFFIRHLNSFLNHS